MKAKKLFTTIMSLVLVACMAFAVAACNNDKDVPVDKVMMDRPTLTIDVGSTYQLSATVLPASATAKSAVWKSDNSSVASVDQKGVVTGVSEGQATIKVTVDGKSDTCTVTVNDTRGQAIPVSSISLSDAVLKMDPKDTDKLEVTFEPANSTNRSVSWVSYNTDVATVAQDGTVTAVGGGVSVIVATVYATADSNVARTDYCVVQVSGDPVVSDERLYVAKVDSLDGRDDFIMGMDASAVPSIENARRAYNEPLYKNFNGVEEDVFKILKDNGITDIRIRVWNDPKDASGNWYGGGNCDINNAVAIATRCKAAGLGVIIDFHYSDFWADPGKQKAPKEWASLGADEVAAKIEEFTTESLNAIKTTGVKITMVQIGNETNSSMAGATDWATIAKYMNAGSRAVRAVTGTVASGGAKVAVHFTNPEKNVPLANAAYLKANNVDYDVLGTSYYPYWHGTLDNLSAMFQQIHSTYNKEVMVLETSYAFTYDDADGASNTNLDETPYPVSLQGQVNCVRDVIETVANLGSYGLGVCYWEGTWIAASTSTNATTNRSRCKEYGCGWASSYAHDYDSSADDGGCVIDNQAFWLSDGTPLESLKVFKLVKEGQATNLKAYYIAPIEDYFTVSEGEIILPSTVDIVLNSGSTMPNVSVYWAVTEAELAEYIKNVNMYDIVGTTRYGGEAHFYAWVNFPNLLEGGSFEADEGVTAPSKQENGVIQTSGLGPWKLNNKATSTSDRELYVSSNGDNARMGTQSFHFWFASTVNFTLSQTVDLSKLSTFGNGKYTCSFDIQGGQAADDMQIFAYIKVTYNDGTTATTINGNEVKLTVWQDWHRTTASVNIADLSKVASIEVGISVFANAAEDTDGPWGNIDNAQFYFG